MIDLAGKPVTRGRRTIPVVEHSSIGQHSLGHVGPSLVPARKGTHIANTRRFGDEYFSRISLCTQLAPARHVVQVGEINKISRVFPASVLNRCRSSATFLSSITPAFRVAGSFP